VLTAAGVPASRNRLDPHITSAFSEGASTGRISDENVAWFASRGPGKLVERIRIPTLLTQGTVDTLFTLDEAATNYAILRRNGVPTKMLWFCGGHGACLTSGGDPARLPNAVFAWLRRWLKRDTTAATGPRFEWVDQAGGAHSGSDFPLAAATGLTATGSGVLPLTPGPGEGAAVASTRSTKAVDLAIPAPAAPMHLIGPPRLTLSYTGTATTPATKLYAHIVDSATGVVLGNQVTPIPVTLDGTARTVTRPLEMVSALAKPGSGLTLQVFGASSLYDLQRTAGTVTLSSIRVSVPAVDPTKPPPGYPVRIGSRLRRAVLRLGSVAGLAGARPRALAVRVSAFYGQVRNIVLTVRGARGRYEGRSQARTFAGTRRLVVRLRRVLPAGRYTVTATGRRTDGSPVRAVRGWTKRARRS
jgi:ABC-2 type transport system ATP-binding protein